MPQTNHPHHKHTKYLTNGSETCLVHSVALFTCLHQKRSRVTAAKHDTKLQSTWSKIPLTAL